MVSEGLGAFCVRPLRNGDCYFKSVGGPATAYALSAASAIAFEGGFQHRARQAIEALPRCGLVGNLVSEFLGLVLENRIHAEISARMKAK
jgi:hypothetical protein